MANTIQTAEIEVLKTKYLVCLEFVNGSEALNFSTHEKQASALIAKKGESIRVVLAELDLAKAEKVVLVEKAKVI